MPDAELDLRRFWSRVATHRDPRVCWLWRGGLDSDGYGLFWANGKGYMAHRVAFESFYDDTIPDGFVCRHMCDVRSCCNPRHIRLGSPKQNDEDRFSLVVVARCPSCRTTEARTARPFNPRQRLLFGL